MGLCPESPFDDGDYDDCDLVCVSAALIGGGAALSHGGDHNPSALAAGPWFPAQRGPPIWICPWAIQVQGPQPFVISRGV